MKFVGLLSCCILLRFLRHGHAGLTNCHCSLRHPVPLLWGVESRGAVPPGSRHMPLTTPGCSGPPVMTLTNQAGGFWVGVCGLFAPSGVRPHRACSGLWTAEACDAEVRWPGCRFGEQGKVASASRPHAVTLVLAVRRHPRAGPGTLSPEDGETSGTPGATGRGQLIAATCVLLFLSCR